MVAQRLNRKPEGKVAQVPGHKGWRTITLSTEAEGFLKKHRETGGKWGDAIWSKGPKIFRRLKDPEEIKSVSVLLENAAKDPNIEPRDLNILITALNHEQYYPGKMRELKEHMELVNGRNDPDGAGKMRRKIFALNP